MKYPTHWRLLPLGEICHIQIGRTPARNNPLYWGAGFPWLSISDMKQGRIFLATKETITERAINDCHCQIVNPGTLLLSFKLSIGKLGFNQIPLYTNEAIAALPIKQSSCVDKNFLFRALEHANLERHVDKAAKGKTLNLAKLKEIRIPVPPLDEQRSIAAILDKADDLCEKRRQAINKLHELLESIFLDMFGDPILNSKGWDTLPLGALATDRRAIVDGPFGSSLKPDNYVSHGVRVIRNFNIKDDDFDNSEFKYITDSKFAEVSRSEVKTGDILISTKGTVGNVCLMPELDGQSVLSATGTVRLRLPQQSDIDSEFLVSQMTFPGFKQYIRSFQAGSNQKYLNLAAIRKIRVFIPPKEMQMHFRERKRAIRKSLESMEQSRLKTEHLFLSIQQRAFEASPGI